jgi:phytoene/squalene synthetase
MNVSKQLNVDIDEAFKLADKIIHDQKAKAWRLSKVFINKEKRNHLFLCHSYLRWVDDFVDNKNNTVDEKRKFINNQKKLLVSILSGAIADIHCIEDYYLYYIIQYALSVDNTTLANEILNMIKTFEMDIQRIENNGIFTQQELDRYAKGQANALFRILYSFFPTKKEPKNNIKAVALASLHHFYLLRDFTEDLKLGYINISKEEIEKYKLNETDLADVTRLTEWVAYKISFIEKMMDSEIVAVKEMPLKLKFLLYGLFPYLYIKIQRIKLYEYNIENLVNKNFLREIKIYYSAAIFDLKVFAKIFL